MADVDEAVAHNSYRVAVDRAARKLATESAPPSWANQRRNRDLGSRPLYDSRADRGRHTAPEISG